MRAAKALFDFDVVHSLFYNPAVIIIVMHFLILVVSIILEQMKPYKSYIRTRRVSFFITLGTIVGNCIIRNILLLLFGIDLLGDILIK